MARACIDLREQLTSLARQRIDGAREAAKFATAAVVDAPCHVTGRHVIELLVDHLQRALNAARRGIADHQRRSGRHRGNHQNPEAGTADRRIGVDPAVAGNGPGGLAHLIEQIEAVDQTGIQLLILRGQRQRQLLSLTHGCQQALSAECQLLHPIQIGDKARFHIIGHQYPLQTLAGHLDILAEYLFQLVQVGFGIGTTDILQIAGDTRGNKLRLVAHGAFAGGLLQQQIRRPLVGILKADKFHLQLVALI